jgi:hypothetical protein
MQRILPILAFFLAIVWPTQASQDKTDSSATIQVASDTGDDQVCSNRESGIACATIQYALIVSKPFDLILVACGEYEGAIVMRPHRILKTKQPGCVWLSAPAHVPDSNFTFVTMAPGAVVFDISANVTFQRNARVKRVTGMYFPSSSFWTTYYEALSFHATIRSPHVMDIFGVHVDPQAMVPKGESLDLVDMLLDPCATPPPDARGSVIRIKTIDVTRIWDDGRITGLLIPNIDRRLWDMCDVKVEIVVNDAIAMDHPRMHVCPFKQA